MAKFSVRENPMAAMTSPTGYWTRHTDSGTAPRLNNWDGDRIANIAGVHIDSLHLDAAVETIVDHVEGARAPGYIVTPNAQHVVLFQSDRLLRGIYERALLVVPDGVPLLWAAKLLGTPLRGRVNGTDLMEALCARAAERGLSVFLLGGREGAAGAAASQLVSRYPNLLVRGTYCPPFGFESDAVENQKILAAIAAAQPDILFVGLGAPKQEYWMFRHHQQLAVPVSLGVGCSFEFIGGIIARAPRWMQRCGLEWLHRLSAEPKRLWKRYVVSNALFCILVFWHFAAQLLTPQYARTRRRQMNVRR